MGGQVDLRGKVTSGWIRGENPSGWKSGDRVVTLPTGVKPYNSGDFRVASWPIATSSATLVDGRNMLSEQANLDRSIVIDGVSRFVFH